MDLKNLELEKGQAADLIRHGQRYLRGCLNEEAAEAWTTAIGQALAETGALDAALLRICQAYLRDADALRGPREG